MNKISNLINRPSLFLGFVFLASITIIGLLIVFRMTGFFTRQTSMQKELIVVNTSDEAQILARPTETVGSLLDQNKTSDQQIIEETSVFLHIEPPSPEPVSLCRPPERVLLIIIDGLRPDAIWDKLAAPFLLELATNKAAYTWNADTVAPPLTIPAHTSLFTGLDSNNHGLLENEKYLDLFEQKGVVLDLPTIFTRLKDKNDKVVTAILSGKKQINFFTQPSVDFHFVHDKAQDQVVFFDFEQFVKNYGFDLMFIDFGFTDVTGHEYKWMSTEYLNAVRGADQAVRSVFLLLEDMEILDTTTIIIAADHGGIEDYHGASMPETRTIPWMAIGPCVRKGQIPSEPGIRIFDTAPTILWLLDAEIPSNLDGRVVTEVFEGLQEPKYGPPELISTPP